MCVYSLRVLPRTKQKAVVKRGWHQSARLGRGRFAILRVQSYKHFYELSAADYGLCQQVLLRHYHAVIDDGNYRRFMSARP